MNALPAEQQSPSSRPLTPDGRDVLFHSGVLPLRDELQRAAVRYTNNSHDAEDLLQETLMKAWTGLDSFSPGTNLRAWVHRVMVNTWISSHRRAERRPKEFFAEAFTDAQLAADGRRFETTPSAEAQALTTMPNDDVREAFESLPPSLHTAVYYAYLCQLSYREVAEIEGIPVGTVMSRLHRARRLLRTALVAKCAERRSLDPEYPCAA